MGTQGTPGHDTSPVHTGFALGNVTTERTKKRSWNYDSEVWVKGVTLEGLGNELRCTHSRSGQMYRLDDQSGLWSWGANSVN